MTTWTYTGSLNAPRTSQGYALLSDGRALVAGGYTPGGGPFGPVTFLTSCETYDPLTGVWSLTGDLNSTRWDCICITLTTGKTIILRGKDDFGTILDSCELYDPGTGLWTLTASMPSVKNLFATVLLNNGNLLTVGGWDGSSPVQSCEIYNPLTETWIATGNLNVARFSSQITLLSDGKVLVVGGRDTFGDYISSCEIYDPVTEIWTVTDSLINPIRHDFSLNLLNDGKVLASGGLSVDTDNSIDTCNLYDHNTELWGNTGSLNTPRMKSSSVLCPSGVVINTGGQNQIIGLGSTVLDSNEQYDPLTGLWTPIDSLNTPRYNHGVLLLSGGVLLVIGGFETNPFTALASCELYTIPATLPTIMRFNDSFVLQEWFKAPAGHSNIWGN